MRQGGEEAKIAFMSSLRDSHNTIPRIVELGLSALGYTCLPKSLNCTVV